MSYLLAWDSETLPIKPGLLAPPPVCFSVATKDSAPALLLKKNGADRLAIELKIGTTFVGHNIAYDFGVLCAYRPDLIPAVFQAYADGRVRDTQIRQELLDIAAGRKEENGVTFAFRNEQWVKAEYNLATLERLWLNRDRTEDKVGPNSWRLRYGELDGVPLEQWPDDAVRYAKEDAEGTLAVYLAQGSDVTDEIPQVRKAWALHLQSCWGLRTDGPMVADLEAALLKEKDLNFSRLKDAGFYKAKRATKDQTPDFYEESKKGPRPMKWAKDMTVIGDRVLLAYEGAPPTTDTGKVSTDRDTLVNSGDELLMALGDASGVDKILTTYIPALKLGTEVPVQTRYNTLVNSGRTSSRAPNIQNLPTGRQVGGVRECFIPRPGCVFISVDYDTLELRALAQVCLDLFKFSRMADAIRAGKDLHLEMAASLLGRSYEDVAARKKDKDVKDARQLSKALNFGLPGGLGSETFTQYARATYGVVISQQEAIGLKRQWLNAWPEMNSYFAFISSKVGQGGATIAQLRSGRVRGNVGYTQACNTLFQGLAADGAGRALFEVAHECYVDRVLTDGKFHGIKERRSFLYGCRPVAFIHDEIILEAPEVIAHEAGIRLSEVMCKAMSHFIPDVPVTASPAMMRRWLKGAEAVYVNERLVPWEPEVKSAA